MSDDELFAQMALQQESPDDPRQRRVTPQQQFATSEYTVEELRALVGDTVVIKCVSEAGPWADERQLRYWKNYEVSVEDAVMLDERRFAVILLSPNEEEDEEPKVEAPKPAVKPKKSK